MGVRYGLTTFGGSPAPFPQTRWTTLCRARAQGDRRVLHELLVDYWKPLYAFLRYQGRDADSALDAVQGYFAHLLERDFAATVDANRGRLRSYLLAGLKYYLANEHHKDSAAKRGGQVRVLTLDVPADSGYEPAIDEPPERRFEREWALCVLERALTALRQEFEEAGRGAYWSVLERLFRPSDEAPPAQAALAGEMGVSRDNFKVLLHRARKRYAELVRAEIRDVVAGEDEVEEELANLFRALGRGSALLSFTMSNPVADLICPRCRSVLPPRLLAAICPRCLFLDEPEELAPGTQIGGHTIVAVLGRGGMSTVYRARHAQLNRDVALKILHADSPDFAARFEREAKALARLDDEAIVRIYEYGQHDGLAFIAMQLVEGESLRVALGRGSMSAKQARPIILAVCRALATAHERGVIHRDIKPENVLLAADGSVRVADFGIAQLLGGEDDAERLTQTGALLGTPHYIAPERLVATGPVDGRSDLYSVGVLLYEMLTGRVPIGPLELPGTPLDHVLRRCLQHDPARRYGSASELAADLRTNRGTLDYAEWLWEVGVALLITAACVTGCLAGIRYVAVLAEESRSLTPLEYVAYLPFGVIVLAVLLSGVALASYAALVRYWSRAGLLAAPGAGMVGGGWVVLGLGVFINLLWAVRVFTGAEWMYRYAALYGGMLMVLSLLAAVLTQMNARRTGRGPLRQWPVWLGLAATLLPASCEAVLQLW